MSNFVAVVGDARLVRSRSIIFAAGDEAKITLPFTWHEFLGKILRNFALLMTRNDSFKVKNERTMVRLESWLGSLLPCTVSMTKKSQFWSLTVIWWAIICQIITLVVRLSIEQNILECSSFRWIINIFKNLKCSKLSKCRFL